MLDENTLVVARHNKYLLHHSVEDGKYFGVKVGFYIYSVIEWQFYIFEYRVEVLAKLLHNGTAFNRPWKSSSVLFKLARKLTVGS